MAGESAPALSPEFEKRLANRLGPRRLSQKLRRLLFGYSLCGIAVSLGAMHAAGLDWRIAGLSILIPLIIVGAIFRSFFRPPPAKW
jgi:hypothetical protein